MFTGSMRTDETVSRRIRLIRGDAPPLIETSGGRIGRPATWKGSSGEKGSITLRCRRWTNDGAVLRGRCDGRRKNERTPRGQRYVNYREQSPLRIDRLPLANTCQRHFSRRARCVSRALSLRRRKTSTITENRLFDAFITDVTRARYLENVGFALR